MQHLGFHGKKLDSDAADDETASDATQLEVGVEFDFVEHDHPRAYPKYHHTGLVDRDSLELVVVLHGEVDHVELEGP